MPRGPGRANSHQAVAGQRLARRYRLDRDAAYARLDAIDRTTVVTRFGAVEYAEHGSGEPLLAVHGFFGGCDEALLSLRGLAAGRRAIAPSRFGYLGSSMPAGATVAAQADAFAALLDELEVDRLDAVLRRLRARALIMDRPDSTR